MIVNGNETFRHVDKESQEKSLFGTKLNSFKLGTSKHICGLGQKKQSDDISVALHKNGCFV